MSKLTRKLGRDTITRVRAPLVRSNRDNTLYREWDQATETDIPNCSVQPVALSDRLRYETDAEREHQLIFYQVYAPPHTDIEYTDRVKYDGRLFEMQGQATPYINFYGREHHVAFMLKLREG